MREIKLSDIKPCGNFDEPLISINNKVTEIIDECEKKQAKTPRIGKMILFIINDMGLIDVLEEGIDQNDGWNLDEMYLCLLYTHSLIIRLNDCAQKFLNNITEPAPLIDQLNGYIQYAASRLPNVYGNPEVIGKLQKGKKYYIDFTEAPE
jgi:hypothetical protein